MRDLIESNTVVGLLVLLVISIIVYLNILLFFKIWGMTNNIKKMSEDINAIRKSIVKEEIVKDKE